MAKKAKPKKPDAEIVLAGYREDVQITVDPLFIDEVEDATLAMCVVPERIETPEEQAQAMTAATRGKTLLKRAEAARTKVKAPVLALSRAIDGCCKIKELVELREATERLERVLGAYEAQKRALADAEVARLREEQRKAIAQAGPTAVLPDSVLQAQSAIQRVEQDAKTEGGRLLKGTLWEITDANELYRLRSDLFSVVPNREAIQSAAERGELTAVAGIRVWEDAKLSV